MDMGTVAGQFTASTFVVWIIDLLKRSGSFPWLSSETERLNQFAAILGAAITAAGVHFVMEPSAETGTYVITMSGLTLHNMLHFAEGFCASIATQQTVLKVYQITNVLRKIADK